VCRRPAGSRLFDTQPAAYDSEVTLRLKAAGLVIFGKTNTPEFGSLPTTEPLLTGPTRNPGRCHTVRADRVAVRPLRSRPASCRPLMAPTGPASIRIPRLVLRRRGTEAHAGTY